MPPARDTAEALIAIYESLGALDQLNALGVVASGTIAVADPTVAATTSATLGASALAISLPAPRQGLKVKLVLLQDGTGSRTLGTITPASGALTWVGSAAPTLTTTAAHADILTFECLDGVNYIGSAQLNVH